MKMKKGTLTLSTVRGRYAVCRLEENCPIPDWATAGGPFLSITRTADELSIVCEESKVPPEIKAEREWFCLKVAGPLDFSLTGVLSSLVGPLAKAGISVFAISTFDTDYLLVKQANLPRAKSVLQEAGHDFVS